MTDDSNQGLETVVGSETKMRGWGSMRWHSGLSWSLTTSNYHLDYLLTTHYLCHSRALYCALLYLASACHVPFPRTSTTLVEGNSV